MIFLFPKLLSRPGLMTIMTMLTSAMAGRVFSAVCDIVHGSPGEIFWLETCQFVRFTRYHAKAPDVVMDDKCEKRVKGKQTARSSQ